MKPKRLPRLWCALQGLLPIEACLAAQRGELAWPQDAAENGAKPGIADKPRLPRSRAGRGHAGLAPARAEGQGAALSFGA
ncbi:MAG: hypothetical protein JNK23_19800 [Opitutaceae bacterium]|nr:hypothetical protein [Opitutaceae bacterium]